MAALKKRTDLENSFPVSVLERMGFLLNRPGMRIREAMERGLEPFGLTGKHWGILLVLQEKGSLAQQEIGQCMHVDRTTMVQIIDDLERMGMVERKDHPTDRRAHSIYLTPKGRETLPKVHQLGLKIEKKFLSCLNPKEQKDLYRILRKLALYHLKEPDHG